MGKGREKVGRECIEKAEERPFPWRGRATSSRGAYFFAFQSNFVKRSWKLARERGTTLPLFKRIASSPEQLRGWKARRRYFRRGSSEGDETRERNRSSCRILVVDVVVVASSRVSVEGAREMSSLSLSRCVVTYLPLVCKMRLNRWGI